MEFQREIKCFTKHDPQREAKCDDDLVNNPPHYKYNDKGNMYRSHRG